MKKLTSFVIIFVLIIIFIGCNGFSTSSNITDLTSTLTTDSSGSNSSSSVTYSISTNTTITTFKEEIFLELNPGVDTIEVNTSFVDAGVNAYYGDFILEATILENTVDITKIGVYYISYQVSYGSEVKEIFRVVFVIDTISPEISLSPGIDTLVLGETWVDAGVIISDNSEEEIVAEVKGTVNVNEVGTYEITYEAIDSSGNKSVIVRYVHIISKAEQTK